MNVLVVNGREAGRPAENASYYVQKVLAPSTAREAWTGATRPKVISEADLSAEDLSQYDCVFLCNVALVTPTEATLLQAYAEAGGASFSPWATASGRRTTTPCSIATGRACCRPRWATARGTPATRNRSKKDSRSRRPI